MKATAIVAGLVALSSSLLTALVLQDPPWRAFVAAGSPDRRQSEFALEAIAPVWRDGYASMVVDVAR